MAAQNLDIGVGLHRPTNFNIIVLNWKWGHMKAYAL